MLLKNVTSVGSKDVLMVMAGFIVVAQLYKEGLISEDIYNQVLYTLSTILIAVRKWMEIKAEKAQEAEEAKNKEEVRNEDSEDSDGKD